MKFLAAMAAYLMIGVVLGAGVFEAAKGHFWLLVVGAAVYLIALTKLGCLPPGNAH